MQKLLVDLDNDFQTCLNFSFDYRMMTWIEMLTALISHMALKEIACTQELRSWQLIAFFSVNLQTNIRAASEAFGLSGMLITRVLEE